MSAEPLCPGCGVAPIGAAGPDGLCPVCVLRLAVEGTATGTNAEASSSGEHAERIDHYRILETLGEGGMGVVYLAEQEEPVRRRVALKLIKWGMDTRQVVARFESERQALAMMNHPNIARVYDGGATPEGRPYFVMEYVKGEPITSYCDKQRLGTEERLELFLQVCEGVQHAHHKGVIHRDLKPSNVLVRVQDGRAVPKIIDFGVAKATTAQRLTDKTLYTQFGMMVGTPEYMSPEQAEMTSLDIDTRTDVYSLGVLFYELLVGARPFDTSDSRALSFDEIRRRIREEEPPKPSTRVTTLGGSISARAAERRRTDVSGLRRELEGDLDCIALKALEKDRTRRYGSPADLATDIRRHRAHEPVLARAPSTAYRVKKFVMRHRGGVAAAAFAIVALTAGAVLATAGMLRAERARGEAKQEADTARQVSDFLVGLFQVADPQSSENTTVTARELLDNGAKRIEHELAGQPLLKARMQETMGRVYRGMGLYDEADRLMSEALRVRRDLLGPRDPEVARGLSQLGALRFAQGRLEEGKRLELDALEIQQTVLGPDHLDTAWSRYYLALNSMNMGEYGAAREALLRAMKDFERELGPDDLAVAWCLNDLGTEAWEGRGDLPSAAEYYRRALEIKRRRLRPDQPDVAFTMGNLGSVLAESGRYEEARPLLEESLATLERALGPTHDVTAEILRLLGDMLRRTGDYDRSRLMLERAVSIHESMRDSSHPNRARALADLAALEGDTNHPARAEQLYRRALSVLETSYGSERPRLVHAETLEEFAALLRKEGREAEASREERRAAAIRDSIVSDENRRSDTGSP